MDYFDSILRKTHRKAVMKRVIAVLSAVVLLFTINTTKKTADTLERIPTCGVEEHVHTDACFDVDGNLICGFVEHVHTDACYQERPKSVDTFEPPVEEYQIELSDADQADNVLSASTEAGSEANVMSMDIDAPVEELGELELEDINGEDNIAMPSDESEVFPESEESQGYIVGTQNPCYLSDIIADQGLNIAIDDVVEIGQAIENDDDPILFNFELVDGDIALYVKEDFERAELVITTEDALHVVELMFGIAPIEETGADVREAEVSADEPADVSLGDIDQEQAIEGEEREEGLAEAAGDAVQASDVEDDQLISEPAEDEAELLDEVAEDIQVEQDAGKDDETVEQADESTEEIADAEESADEQGDAVAADETEGEAESEKSDESKAEETEEAEDEESDEFKEEETEAAENEQAEEADGVETEEEAENEQADETEEEQTKEEAEDEKSDESKAEETEEAAESKKSDESKAEETEEETEDEKSDESKAEETEEAGSEKSDESKDEETEEETEDEKSGESKDEETEDEKSDAADGEEIKEGAEDEQTGEVQGDETEAPDVGAQPVPQEVVYAYYEATINLADVEAYPIALTDLMARATWLGVEETAPAADVEEAAAAEPVSEPVETEPPEADVLEEDVPDEGTAEVVEAEAVDPVQSEAAFELDGEEIVEPEVPEVPESDAWVMDYDASVLSVERDGDDYALSILTSFEQTTLTVDNGEQYRITLLNGAAPVLYPAAAFAASTEYVTVSVEAPEGAFPAGTTMVVRDVDDEDTLHGISDKVEEGFVRVERVHAVDITFLNADGEEIEPLIPISVVMTVREIEEEKERLVVHVDHEGEAQLVDNTEPTTTEVSEQNSVIEAADESSAEAGTAVAFTAESFSVYAVVVGEKLETKVIAADGNTYRIEVTYTEDAGIPSGATLDVSEVTGDESYRALVEESLAENKRVTLARFFDIRIMNGAEVIQPAVPVTVKVELVSDENKDNEAVPCAVHFAEDEVQVIDATEEDEAVSFRAESFSVWGVVYTVDFHYVIDGKEFAYSLPGGGFMRLSDLVRILGLAGEDADEALNGAEDQADDGNEPGETEIYATDIEDAVEEAGEITFGHDDEAEDADEADAAALDGQVRRFLEAVDAVTFSNPELLWTGRVEADTTIGALKMQNELKPQYSMNMSLAEVRKSDSQAILTGDWALISLLPFDTEETLTIRMENGEEIKILVTDAQLKQTVVSARGETYEITVTYGEDAMIPDGAELRVEEILPEDERYQEYFKQSMVTLGATAPEADEAESTENDEEESGDAADASPSRRITSDYARIFDIEIWANDQKVEPASEVMVSIRLLDVPADTEAIPQVVHFAGEGAELMTLEKRTWNGAEDGILFVTDEFSVYSIVYTVDFSYEVDGKVYGFTMQGADSVSLRALIEALHVYELSNADRSDLAETQTEVTNDALADQEGVQNAKLDQFMNDIESVTFSDESLLVPAKVTEDDAVGNIKWELGLFPSYPLGLTQSEVLALNAKTYTAGDWALISMKAFDTEETLTITMKDGQTFDIVVTDAQDAVMIGDIVQTISNPAGTTIDLFDYWITEQNIAGRDAWPGLNQGWGGHDDPDLNGAGNNMGINSSTSDTEHGHALKFSPAWEGTVYNGNRVSETTGKAWESLNANMRNGLNSYTGDEYTWHWDCPKPFTGIVQNYLYNNYPILTSNQQIGSNGESLAYLFDPSIAHVGKASYSGVNQLLYVDKDGYYTYDSRDYKADFNKTDKTFTLTEQTSSDASIRGFWPFGVSNFWAGLHMKTQFSIPTNGRVMNPSGVYKPMQFEFSGDDDVWIYVDGILIGDAGGIHNRTEVDINFQTGKVSISTLEDTYLDVLFRTGLKDQGKSDAEIEAYMEENFDGHTFKAGTYHTFDFFYLERGGDQSNMYIHYNLVSTSDFTAHKSYYGEDEEDVLKRDQFQFELIGLDGKYRSVMNAETGQYELELEDANAEAIMPIESRAGAGTVASPHYEDNVTTALSTGNVNSQIYITGVSEDGNVNFGTAEIDDMEMHDADEGNGPVYKYIIREIVPDDAVNADGVTWANASDAQKAAGGFVKDNVTYDGTVYYMTGRVIKWTEANGTVMYGLSKTYYTDDTYTTVKSDVSFASFENRYTPDFGNVDFKKIDGAADPLPGAVFTLYKDEACETPARALDVAGKPVWTATSDSTGKVSFENVRTGTYYMKETGAPEGFELDDTVYKVVIEDSKDKTKKSKITILGDESETAVTEIANTERGKITVLKKWLDASGKEIAGGSNTATVQLKRRHMVADKSESSGSYTVTITQSVVNYGNGDQQVFGPSTVETVQSDKIVIEWDDEWQDNFNWTLAVGTKTYEGYVGDGNPVTGECYTIEKISVDGRSRRLTVTNIDGDVSFATKYHVNWLYTDNNHWNNLNSPVITEVSAPATYHAEEDETFNAQEHTQALKAANTWAHMWSIGGTESSHAGYDFPAKDDSGQVYLYYVVELDKDGNALEVGGSPEDGFVLRGYSANNSTGISDNGLIQVFNQTEGPSSTDITLKKVDRDDLNKDNPNLLKGASFTLSKYTDEEFTVKDVSWGTEGSGSVTLSDERKSDGTYPLNGVFTFKGLTVGCYQLEEISFPDGYVKLSGNPTFKIEANASNGLQIKLINNPDNLLRLKDDRLTLIVGNTPGAVLPATGGPGTRLYTLSGIGLMALAAFMLLRKRARNTL